jgi:acyl carrier protein
MSLQLAQAVSEVDKLVSEHFNSLNIPPPSSDSQNLRDAGLSSLQVVDLVFLLECGLGLEIPDAEVTPQNFRSVQTIALMLTRLRPSRD